MRRTASSADVQSGRCELRLQDYRDVAGSFDRIVSIEMLEAVGEAYWPTYFAKLRDRLRPGGIAVLQVITIDETRFENYRRRPDFIQKYIFPGGMLPTKADHRTRGRRRRATAGPHGFVRPKLCAHARGMAAALRGSLAGDRSRSASTSASSACGSTISPIARQASKPARST